MMVVTSSCSFDLGGYTQAERLEVQQDSLGRVKTEQIMMTAYLKQFFFSFLLTRKVFVHFYTVMCCPGHKSGPGAVSNQFLYFQLLEPGPISGKCSNLIGTTRGPTDSLLIARITELKCRCFVEHSTPILQKYANLMGSSPSECPSRSQTAAELFKKIRRYCSFRGRTLANRGTRRTFEGHVKVAAEMPLQSQLGGPLHGTRTPNRWLDHANLLDSHVLRNIFFTFISFFDENSDEK